jgi:hypothetical protein
VLPTPLVTGRGEGFIQSFPEAKRAVAHRDVRRDRKAPRLRLDSPSEGPFTAII